MPTLVNFQFGAFWGLREQLKEPIFKFIRNMTCYILIWSSWPAEFKFPTEILLSQCSRSAAPRAVMLQSSKTQFSKTIALCISYHSEFDAELKYAHQNGWKRRWNWISENFPYNFSKIPHMITRPWFSHENPYSTLHCDSFDINNHQIPSSFYFEHFQGSASSSQSQFSHLSEI